VIAAAARSGKHRRWAIALVVLLAGAAGASTWWKLRPRDVSRAVLAPEPTARYGAYVGRLCQGCHGEHLSGGPIPGTPSSMAVPGNLTMHETGLRGWTYADLDRLLMQGIRKDGRRIDAAMPIASLGRLTEIEKRALWAYLESLPPRAYGGR